MNVKRIARKYCFLKQSFRENKNGNFDKFTLLNLFINNFKAGTYTGCVIVRNATPTDLGQRDYSIGRVVQKRASSSVV